MGVIVSFGVVAVAHIIMHGTSVLEIPVGHVAGSFGE